MNTSPDQEQLCLALRFDTKIEMVPGRPGAFVVTPGRLRPAAAVMGTAEVRKALGGVLRGRSVVRLMHDMGAGARCRGGKLFVTAERFEEWKRTQGLC